MKIFCDVNCDRQCKGNATPEIIKANIKAFSKIEDEERKRGFLMSHIETLPPTTAEARNKRSLDEDEVATGSEFFIDGGKNKRICVCPSFFKKTYCVSDEIVRSVIKKKINKEEYVEITSPQYDEKEEFIKFQRDLIERHRYDKKYVAETNYRECSLCAEFSKDVGVQKRDLKEKHDSHIKEVEFFRDQYDTESGKASPTYVVARLKMRETIALPTDKFKFKNGSSLSLSDKSKEYLVYNFNVQKIPFKDVTCYVWHEREGTNGFSEIGSCILKFIKETSFYAEEPIDFIFYSDKFRGAEECDSIISVYSYALAYYNIRSIVHRFFIENHNFSSDENEFVNIDFTEMMEKRLKDYPIFTPEQYASLIKNNVNERRVFHLREMKHDDFYDFKKLGMDNNIFFSKYAEKWGVNIQDLKEMIVSRDKPGTYVMIKTFLDPFESHKTACLGLHELKPLYASELPVSEEKIDGILKGVEEFGATSSRHYGQFYKSLIEK